MRLQYTCKNCHKTNRIDRGYADRGRLQRELGSSIELECRHCNLNQIYTPNDVFASSNEWVQIAIFIIVLFTSLLLGWSVFEAYSGKFFYLVFVIPIVMGIPSLIYFNYIKSENQRVRVFNKFRSNTNQ
jgi:hypothetical protein